MNVAYVYPWDIVGDPSAPARLAALGVDTIALAASYHSTRAATPYHPAHRVLDVPYPAFYLPIRPQSWGRLTPAAPTWTPPDAYVQAQTALREAGLKVHAWIVLTHNSHLGTRFPDLTVRNAFGDPYPYALCPAHEDVQEYCERLVTETLTLAEPDGLILEACGPMGFGHQSVHEKTSGADWTQVDTDLLSLCFCTTCTPLYPPETPHSIRTTIDTPSHQPPTQTSPPDTPPSGTASTNSPPPNSTALHHSQPDTPAAISHPQPHPTAPTTTGRSRPYPAETTNTSTTDPHPSDTTTIGNPSFRLADTTAIDRSPLRPPDSMDQALGPLADAVRAVRVSLSTSLRHRLLSVARKMAPNLPITLHANPDPWATGAFAPLPSGDPNATVLVGNCWGDPTADAARLTTLANLCTPTQRVGAYVLTLPPRSANATDLATQLRTYAEAGATEFHLYHAGLASPQRLTAITRALTLLP